MRDIAQRAILSTRSKIAWVSAGSDSERLQSGLYWKGASAAANQSGHRLEEFHLDHDPCPQRLHQTLSTHGIRGLLLPAHEPSAGWRKFPWHEYTVVRFGQSLSPPQTHLVTADHVANTMLAMDAIRQRGYRRIGYVSDEKQDHEDSSLFLAGYLFENSIVS